MRRICRQEGCSAATDGRCLEGLSFEECPNSSLVDEDVEIEEEEEEIEGHEPSVENVVSDQVLQSDIDHHFYGGNELSLDEAYHITASSLSTIIILAGKAESGKTTLLATLYELFLNGPYLDYSFCGSKTLIGFEKRAFLSRIDCGLDQPDTERTKPDYDQKLLHLVVRKTDLSEPKCNLLFTDISGEIFTRALHSFDEIKKLNLIPRADHLVIAIDGDKISNLTSRHETISTSSKLLRACIESKMINENKFVDIIFTKYDIVLSDGADNNTDAYIDHEISSFKNKYESKVGRLRFFKVAARPTKGELKQGYGLEHLFLSWVTECSVRFTTNFNKAPEHPIDQLPEFDKYQYKFGKTIGGEYE